ncbi:hypothetical protein BZG09_05390 [Salinivibrio kushneri]|uniref:Uncharacterized protein n=2 Tax=Salinivibrio kushneri TaxID=1908198 RepID=A0AB36K857_9GAMM|nr:hypothetical protein BZG09_05390 [Salinivibrio kushneri]
MYYFRCEFAMDAQGNKVKGTLESMVERSWSKLNTTDLRTFNIGEDSLLVGMQLSKKTAPLSKGDKPCIVLSIGAYEEDAAASIINKPSTSRTEIQSSTYAPPVNQEYLDDEAFLCIYDDHILISPAAKLRAGAAIRFLEKLLHKGGYKRESTLMDAQQIADMDAIKTIQREGVKNISINAYAYISSIERLKRTNSSHITHLDKLTNWMKSGLDYLRDDDTDADILEKEGLNTRIVISHDGRASGLHVKDGQKHATDTAKLLASSDACGYTITTRSDKKLTHEDTILKSNVNVVPHGKSVDRESMWTELVLCLVNYENQGVLAK